MIMWIYLPTESLLVTKDQIAGYGGYNYDSGWQGPDKGFQIRTVTGSPCDVICDGSPAPPPPSVSSEN